MGPGRNALATLSRDRARGSVGIRVLGQLWLTLEPTNPARALKCFERAASLGSTAAMLDLAGIFVAGEVVEPNPQASYTWLKRAAAGDDPRAWLKLGDVYAEGGLGQEADPDRARKTYERARLQLPEQVEARLQALRE
ncbi:MAG: sel1 repeat family protein [Planctomycetes bacterium]|nr:sel1 repeat family protein [Planctomycetota bacterium]